LNPGLNILVVNPEISVDSKNVGDKNGRDINPKTAKGIIPSDNLSLKDFPVKIKKGTKTERAKNLGKEGARKILELGIKKVVFDRGGFRYHGRIKALAESLREGGLEF